MARRPHYDNALMTMSSASLKHSDFIYDSQAAHLQVSSLVIQLTFIVAVLIAWSGLQHVQWRKAVRGRQIPALHATLVLSIVAFCILALLREAPECLPSATCQKALGVPAIIMDAFVTVSYGVLMVRRMAILVADSFKRYLFLFYVVPIVYPAINILLSLELLGVRLPLSESAIGKIHIAFNVMLHSNTLIVDAMLLYSLTHGPAAARFTEFGGRRRTIALQIVGASLLMIGISLAYVPLEDYRVAITYIFVAWSCIVVGQLHRLIVRAFAGDLPLSSFEQRSAATAPTAHPTLGACAARPNALRRPAAAKAAAFDVESQSPAF